jgi:hypothetical protein
MTLPLPASITRPMERGVEWRCHDDAGRGCGKLLGWTMRGLLITCAGPILRGDGWVPCHTPGCETGGRDWYIDKTPGVRLPDDVPAFVRRWQAVKGDRAAGVDVD